MNNYIYQNKKLISFCNKIQSYENILNDEDSKKIFLDSLLKVDDEHSCEESIDICNFLIQNIDLFNINNCEELKSKLEKIINIIKQTKKFIRL